MKKVKIPELCEDCPKRDEYWSEGRCWVYWIGKKECAAKFWALKMPNGG